jgi:hypothetical protein
MRTQRTVEMDPEFSPHHFPTDRIGAAVAVDASGFTPSFWLDSDPHQRGRQASALGEYLPMSYPLLIGIFLIIAFLMQRSFLANLSAF